MPAHYDDPEFSYVKYWQGRDYEHFSELLALEKILKNLQYSVSADIGGGFGRLTTILASHSKLTYLIEPSAKQLAIAKDKFSKTPTIKLIQGTSESTKLPSETLDLAIVIRVSHHLPDLKPSFLELARVIKADGTLVFELANSVNFKARIQSWFSGTPIHSIPIERRSLGNIRKNTIPFVNHHPDVVKKIISDSGFTIEKMLSVSNFRSTFFKKLLPFSLIVKAESWLQIPLGNFLFGPSIFFVCKRMPYKS